MIIDLNGWIVYLTSAAGILVALGVGAAVFTGYNKYKERKAVERIEAFLYQRFGEYDATRTK